MKMFKRDLTLVKTVLISSLLTGCMVNGGSNGVAVEKWNNFDQVKPVDDVIAEKANVVFVRDEAFVEGKAVNIFVGGEYLASLLPGAYKQVEVCPDNQKLVAIHTDVKDRYLTKELGGQLYNLPKDKTTYLRVAQNEQGQPHFLVMNAEEIQQAQEKAKQQTHTLPRVDKNYKCTAVTPKVLKKITLQAGALFKFDKSDEQNMLEKGKQEIKQVADAIHAETAQISRIDVIGYTDPDGTEAYNQVLSAHRAQSVKQVLMGHGFTSDSVYAEGRGESNLLISDCDVQHAKDRTARLACNQPNRRVEIILYGVQ
ncbi:OmpA family protein [Acinetobacter calcoaceticus]|uniref:OmpA family protein n=1 Tax=Acinetobacter calcoaceticus TaxID=471 RepID=A0A4R1XCZ5_ACICA|nr:OmpA family protein [Acinetobacter calcoaceticus]